jgi:hypothetical protein
MTNNNNNTNTNSNNNNNSNSNNNNNDNSETSIQVTFRGNTFSIPITKSTVIQDVKETLLQSYNGASSSKGSTSTSSEKEEELKPQDLKLIYKGKILSNDLPLNTLVVPTDNHNNNNNNNNIPRTKKQKQPIVIRLLATGISSKETNQLKQELSMSKRNGPRIRDDLSITGRQELAARQRLSRQFMKKVALKYDTANKYGFGRIETLPMLPEQDTAKQILHDLANDPGILACMNKHQWNVGCLKEMYPEGKVGESEVCILGLNRNKGQEILLRIRTDDLKGFRKILSIRKVLFHELAHNVYSEHDSNFFQLNRQIEKECNELDWRRQDGNMLGGGDGRTLGNVDYGDGTHELESLELLDSNNKVYGGTFRLGHGDDHDNSHDTVSPNDQNLSKRELAAKAALSRMSKEDEHFTFACRCGCGCTHSCIHDEKNSSHENDKKG